MKNQKFKKLLFLFCSFVFASLGVVDAQSLAGGAISEGPISGNIFDLVGNISQYIRPAIAVVFLFVIIFGGFTRMTAAGDPEKEKKSNSILTAGVVGFVIIVLAPVIVKIVTSLIGVEWELF